MDITISIISIVIGLIVGSFLNVVILRINSGMSFSGRSKCFSCGTTLRWWNLFPVLSFLFQRGKCSSCNTRISWQYPIVEVLMSIISYISMFIAGGFSFTFLFLFLLGSILVVVSVYDVYHMIILDKLLIILSLVVIIFMGLSIVVGFDIFAGDIVTLKDLLKNLLGAIVVPLPFFLVWYFSKGKLIGFGDIKLMSVIGLTLGVYKGATAVILGFWIGGLFVILLFIKELIILLTSRHHKLKTIRSTFFKKEIPFGPFLCFGFYLIALVSLPLLDILQVVF